MAPKYEVTLMDQIIYLCISPTVIVFCVCLTAGDFKNYKELIIKRKRFSLYLALYLLLIVSLFETFDILSLMMNTTVQNNSYCEFSGTVKMFLFDFAMFIMVFSVKVIRKQIEDPTYQTEKNMGMLFMVALLCCIGHQWMVNNLYNFGSSQDGLCREMPITNNFFDKLMINVLYIPFMITLCYDYYRIMKVGTGMVAVILHVYTYKIKVMIVLMLLILGI